jgi:diaminopropionate ammonia-lyase
LLAAVASWIAWRFGDARPLVIGVEPIDAACVQASARAGRAAAVPGPFSTTMAGLRCGEASRPALSAILSVVDGFVAIEDEWTFDAMRLLATPANGDPRVEAGASGAAAVGGLLAVLRAPEGRPVRARLGLGAASRVLAIVSEGVTDPAVFARVVGRPPAAGEGGGAGPGRG